MKPRLRNHLLLALSICLLGTILPHPAHSQNHPACDSLYITGFGFDTIPGQLILQAENQSNYLFDYPGFIFFSPNMDTLAMETVNYFGIGMWPQSHTLPIKNPITLPQSGFLSLYTIFYDTLRCTWPMTLSDTLTGVAETVESRLQLVPNPASDRARILWSGPGERPASVTIHDMSGRQLAENLHLGTDLQFPVERLVSGVYIVEIRDADRRLLAVQKLRVE